MVMHCFFFLLLFECIQKFICLSRLSLMLFRPIDRKTLGKYVPSFDPSKDPQVGEWVLVTPYRRAALVDPLIRMILQEGLRPLYPFLCESNSTSTLSVGSVFDTVRSASFLQVDPSCFFPTLEEVRRKYRRHRGVAVNSGCGLSGEQVLVRESHVSCSGCGDGKDDECSEDDDDDTILYLNPQSLLLTACIPAEFGGSDYIEGFDKVTGRVVFVNWRTGDISTDAAVLKLRPRPGWAEEVVEKAMVEWDAWQRRQVIELRREEKECGAPPPQKLRKE